MDFVLPKLYPVTDVSLTELSHLEQVKRFIAGGATFIQLREKHVAPKEFYESAKTVLDYTRGTDIKIIINDRVDIALAVKADGVHLGQHDLPPACARKILGDEAIIGFSTHNLEQAVEAAELPINYIAVGPVFATKSKENPDPVVGLENLKKVREAVGDFPLVAIGGINFENFRAVIEYGADSLALISTILIPAEDISENIRRIVKHS